MPTITHDCHPFMSATLHDLQLPPQASEHHPAPAFMRLADCKRWLATVPITNTALAREQLLQQLERLYHQPLPASERLAMLEFLRDTLHFIHDEWQRPYRLQRPALPLAGPHQESFSIMQRLWQALSHGYLRILQAHREAAATATASKELDSNAQQQAALAATRALAAMQQLQLDHHLLGLIPPAAFWRQLHRSYFAAETLAISQSVDADKSSPLTRYIEILLLAAAQAHALQTRQLDQVAYWARRWAPKVGLSQQPPEDLRTPPLCINLASDAPASHQPAAASDTLRWLNLHTLRKTIKQRLLKLSAGASPQELKLGKHCQQPACQRLLQRVYRDWCKGGHPDNLNLSSTASNSDHDLDHTPHCDLLTGLDEIHFQLSGRPFQPPRQSIYLGQQAHAELATFGHRTGQQADQPPAQASERWLLSASDVVKLQLRRVLSVAPADNKPLMPGQLLGLRLADEAAHWQLACLDWLACASDAGSANDADTLHMRVLHAGVRLLPGKPQALTIIRKTDGSPQAEYARGFQLPALPGVAQDASLLLPSGWFRAALCIECIECGLQGGERRQRVRLDELLERGANFERCRYSLVD